MTGDAGTIQILHVDDDANFGELVEDFLEAADDRFDIETASSATRGLEHVRSGDVDCVVSDFEMPGLDGIEFLERVREDHPELPFILFTGRGSETVASDAISAGVTDYLKKQPGTDQFALLANRIRNYTEKREVERALDKRERQLEHLGEQDLVGVYIIQDGEFIYANPRLAEMHGYTPEEIIGRSPGDLVVPEDREVVERALERRLEGDVDDKRYQVTGRRTDGSTIDLELHGSRIQLEGEPAVIGVAQDITERENRERELRESLETYEGLFHGLNDAVFVYEPGGEFLAVNRTACERLGYDEDEFRDMKPTDIDAPEHGQSVTDRVATVLDHEGHTFESVHVTKSGERIPVEISASSIDYFGEEAILSVARDRSRRVESERKLRRMKRAVDASGHAIYLTDVDGTIQYVNPAFETITGYTASEAVGQTPRILNSGEMSAAYFEELWETILSGAVWEEEVIDRTKGGDLYYAHQTIAPIRDPDGEIQAFVAIQTDVTDRKEVKRELSTLVDNLPGIVYRCKDETGWPMDVVRGDSLAVTGYAAERLEGGEISYGEDIVHPDDRQRVREAVRDAVERDESFDLTYRIRTKGGSVKWVWEKGQRIRRVGSDSYRLEGFITDITQREEQKRRLERYKHAVESSTDMLAAVDPGLSYRFVNERYREFHDFPENTDPSQLSLNDVHAGEELSAIRDRIERALAGEQVEYEVERTDSSGERRTLSIRYDPVKDDGTIQGVVAALRDVTERERREQRLQKRERLMSRLHSTAKSFIGADSRDEVFQFLQVGTDETLQCEDCVVLEHDTQTGSLSVVETSRALERGADSNADIPPGETPLWDVYRDGESKILSAREMESLPAALQIAASNVLATPIGDYGVLVTGKTGTEAFDENDIELVELLATYGEAILDRIERTRTLDRVSAELNDEQSRTETLLELVEAIRSIRKRIVASDTRSSLSRGVCEELTRTEFVDFAFVATPETPDTNLAIDTWSGSEREYLNAVTWDSTEVTTPTQEAAKTREVVQMSDLQEHVYGASWAKEAISRKFNSVISFPLVHDDVLYGVLTLFSREKGAFQEPRRILLQDIRSLMETYVSILNSRQIGPQSDILEIEFEIRDPNCVLYHIASEAMVTIRLKTVLEELEDSVRLLFQVVEGDPEDVISAAENLAQIESAEYFGQGDGETIAISTRKPYIGSEVTAHGGRLVAAEADQSAATVWIKLSARSSVRPFVSAISTRFDEIDLVARRETRTSDRVAPSESKKLLTERQLELVKAAYFGGYYDRPRGITGEQLGADFGISNSAVHKHIRNAHKSLVERLFDITHDTAGLNG